MKKLSLNLDDLQVESFETAGTGEGVVFGYDPVSCPSCAATCSTCEGQSTCFDTCGCIDTRPADGCGGTSGGFICV